MEREKNGRPDILQEGYRANHDRGHQPAKPDAGHQPSAPGGRPEPPTTGSGVKPPPAKPAGK